MMTTGAKRPDRRWWPWVLAALVVAALAVADHRGWLLAVPSDDMKAYHEVSTRVLKVVDGDTLDVDVPDSTSGLTVTRVRLWGVNCPERAGPDRPAEPWAEEALAAVRRLAGGGMVRLELEGHRRRGTYGRVLAHVTLEDGRLLSEVLLESGLGTAQERWPHAYLRRYREAERRAQEARLGVWARE